MKIVKTASGKNRIKISKKEWTSIGKQSGWIKFANEGEIIKDKIYFKNKLENDEDFLQEIVDANNPAGGGGESELWDIFNDLVDKNGKDLDPEIKEEIIEDLTLYAEEIFNGRGF